MAATVGSADVTVVDGTGRGLDVSVVCELKDLYRKNPTAPRTSTPTPIAAAGDRLLSPAAPVLAVAVAVGGAADVAGVGRALVAVGAESTVGVAGPFASAEETTLVSPTFGVLAAGAAATGTKDGSSADRFAARASEVVASAGARIPTGATGASGVFAAGDLGPASTLLMPGRGSPGEGADLEASVPEGESIEGGSVEGACIAGDRIEGDA